jgi:hypothetical protein
MAQPDCNAGPDCWAGRKVMGSLHDQLGWAPVLELDNHGPKLDMKSSDIMWA